MSDALGNYTKARLSSTTTAALLSLIRPWMRPLWIGRYRSVIRARLCVEATCIVSVPFSFASSRNYQKTDSNK